MDNINIGEYKKKILFISHDGSRTGAPLVLINLLKFIKTNSQIDCSLILLSGGSYVNEFSESVNGSMIIGIPKGRRLNRLKFYLRAFVNHIREPKKNANPWKILNNRYDFVYGNTIVSARFGYYISQKNKSKFILHVHELEYSGKVFYSNWNRDINYDGVFKFIAISNYSLTTCIKQWNIPLDKLTKVSGFIDIQNIKVPLVSEGEIRKQLCLRSSFVVGGCGVASWRKGFDLFINLCKLSKKYEKNWEFIWVGELSRDQLEQIEYERNRMEIGNLILTGETDVPQN